MYKLQADNPRDQIEHMSFGGLWVGGRGGPDGMVHVSTAIVDGVFEAGEEGFEFTNTASAGDTVQVRSTIVTSPYFSPDAVSHQDFVSTFTDLNTRVPGTDFEIPNHTPLGLSVTLRELRLELSLHRRFCHSQLYGHQRLPLQNLWALPRHWGRCRGRQYELYQHLRLGRRLVVV